jgi:hypothetical protein
MLTSVLIAVGMTSCVIVLSWIGIELTIHPPQRGAAILRVRVAIFASAAVMIGLTIWSTKRGEAELDNLPKRVADFIKNTTPPATLPVVGMRPAPPTGLVVSINGDWGSSAILLGNQLNVFLDSQGTAPARAPGESDLTFIGRSNAWYSKIMQEYNNQFEDQVITMVRLLIDKGVLDKRVATLSINPVNPIGVRAIATQLVDGGNSYRSQYGPR